jgi:integrase
MGKRAGGDRSPDENTRRFPAAVVTPTPVPGLTTDALLAGWAADHGWQTDATPIARPLYDRKRTMARLAAFLDTTDASGVTQGDAVRWKEDMQSRGLHASTIRNDLSEMSAVWPWGLRNGKLSGVNPFAGISPPKAKKKSRDPRAFTDTEAATVLRAARDGKGAYRWRPWVACLTGARVSELCQADKADVSHIDSVAVIRIHDEGADRSVKTDDSRRTIPIHSALIANGRDNEYWPTCADEFWLTPGVVDLLSRA